MKPVCRTISTGGLAWFVALALGAVVSAQQAPPDVPPVPREFRAAWIATVANIDWPSRPGLPPAELRRELTSLLDRAAELKLNAVVLQIRPAADALYKSPLEPWSEYLTGRMGEPPAEDFDPLEFAVREAHARGLQLHAWFNPYRARHADGKGPAAPNHVSVAHPEIVRKYGRYLWLDPGEPAAVDQFIAVVHDVVERYDVDGVHIDDYFYPYKELDAEKHEIAFPDDESYARAVAVGEKLDRDDWRRQNVDRLVERMYAEVKQTKPWVLVGISPFGIWRPGHPEGVVGFDQYAELYADARKWLREGWIDYFTPQIYWKVSSKGQPFARLLAWWCAENVADRHIWPGLFTSKVASVRKGKKRTDAQWSSDEIVRQIEATRAQPDADGHVHFSMKALMGDRDGLAEKLSKLYAEPALVPKTTWIKEEAPPELALSVQDLPGGLTLSVQSADKVEPWQWVARLRTDAGWQTAIVPGSRSSHTFKVAAGQKPLEAAASAVSRLGHEGPLARTPIDATR